MEKAILKDTSLFKLNNLRRYFCDVYLKIDSSTKKLLILMMLFKLSIDAGYWNIVALDKSTYVQDFNLTKYIVGIVWCIILFLGIKHNEKRPSTFFLCVIFLLQIVPITTIYSLGNQNSLYYFTICIAFLLCEALVGCIKNNVGIQRNSKISEIIEISFILIVLATFLAVVIKNGLPSLVALNIYNVYDLRENNPIDVSGYLNYFFQWSVNIIIPFLIAKCLLLKKYFLTVLLCLFEMLMYLYSGHKSILFTIPLVIICTLWSRRKNFYKEIFTTVCIGMSVLVLFACISSNQGDIFNRIFSLTGRRMMLLSANNKFVYFDYFSDNPLMGLGGIFPRWLVYIPNYYENIPYTYEISDIYFNKSEMNSNTGFIAEGFMRFGHIGILIVFLAMALLLRQMDKLGKRTNYSFAIGIFVTQIIFLADGHLIDSFILGNWMILVAILAFYTKYQRKKYEFKKYGQIKKNILSHFK